MRMTRIALLFVLCHVAFAGPKPLAFSQEKEPAEEALGKLQGQWMFEKGESNKPGPWSIPEESIYIERNVLHHVKKTGELIFNGSRSEITVDPSKKPMTIDLVRKNGNPGQKILGIYKIDGNRLIIATNTRDQETRPGDFTTKGAGAATNLQTFKLVEGEKPAPAKAGPKLTQAQMDAAVAEGLKKLQGRWLFEKSERNGFSSWTLPEESILIDKNVLHHCKKNGDAIFNGARAEFTIDPTKAPMTIDLIRKNGNPGQKILGIYKIEGNRLIIATNTADDNKDSEENRDVRPAQFTTKLSAKLERAVNVQTYKLVPPK